MSYNYPIVLDNPSYISFEDADKYMRAATNGGGWRAADDNTKAQALVTAVRTLDRQSWLGEVTDSDQALQWPRKNTGVVGVIDTAIPIKIQYAAVELAEILIDGSEDVLSEANAGQKIKSLKAGSVSIDYFRDPNALFPVRFPPIVNELIRDYTGGSVIAPGAESFGTQGETITRRDFGFNRGL